MNLAFQIAMRVRCYFDCVFEKEIYFFLFCKLNLGLEILRTYLKLLDVFNFRGEYKLRIDDTTGRGVNMYQ